MERIKRALANAVEKRKQLLADEAVGGAYRLTPAAAMWLAIAATVFIVVSGSLLWFDRPSSLDAVELSSLEVVGQRVAGSQEDLELLIHKIDALTASVSLLEGKLQRLSMLVNSTHARATGIGPVDRVSSRPDIDRAAPGDQWVVTLASLPSKLSADRFSRAAQAQGVDVKQFQVKVAGQDFWRIQVTDFDTAEAARAYAGTVEQKLGLKDVWISQR